MTFRQWLHQQIKRQDAVGDFARDAEYDREFPRTHDIRKFPSKDDEKDILEYLNTETTACGACLVACSRAYEEYKKANMTVELAFREIRKQWFLLEFYVDELTYEDDEDAVLREIQNETLWVDFNKQTEDILRRKTANDAFRESRKQWLMCPLLRDQPDTNREEFNAQTEAIIRGEDKPLAPRWSGQVLKSTR